MKKISQDKDCAVFRHNDGHEIKVALKSLSPELRKTLDKLPHAAEGMDTANDPQVDAQQPTPDFAGNALRNAGISPAPSGDQVENSPVPAPSSLGPEQEDTPRQYAAPPQETPEGAPAEPAPEDDPAQNQPPPEPKQAPVMPDPVPKTYQQAGNDTMSYLRNERQAIMNDYTNGKIQHKTLHDALWKDSKGNDKGTLGKIGTIFGMMMSGMGSGLLHQPNVLLDMMNKEVERDNNDQIQNKANAFKSHDLFLQHAKYDTENKIANSQIDKNSAEATYLRGQGQIQAMAIKRQLQNQFILNDLMDKVKKFPPNSAQYQAAQQALSTMVTAVNDSNANVEQQAAVKSSLLHQQLAPQFSNNPEQQRATQNRANPILYGDAGTKMTQYNETHHIPNVGDFSSEVGKDDKAAIEGHQKLDAGLRDLTDFAKNHSTIIPGTKEYNIGQTKVRKLQADIRDSVLNTVYREGEQPLLDKFVGSNPAGIDKFWKTIPQLQTLREINNRDMGVKLKNMGYLGGPLAKQLKGGGGNSSGSGQQMKQVKYQGKIYNVPVK